MKKCKDIGIGEDVIVPNMPVVYESAVRDFASKWEMAKENDPDAVFFNIGDIRESLVGNTPFSTNADPIEDIMCILHECGLQEISTQHSGVVFVLRPRTQSKNIQINEISLF